MRGTRPGSDARSRRPAGASEGHDGVVSTLARAVESVLRATEHALLEAPHESISSTPSSVRQLIAEGDEVVAYETLCENLYEIDVRPPAELGRALRRAVVEAGADPSLADLLLA